MIGHILLKVYNPIQRIKNLPTTNAIYDHITELFVYSQTPKDGAVAY